MGVNTLWLMPVHPVGLTGRKGKLGSPYSICDYIDNNPEFCNKFDLKNLIDQAHKLDMKVILDLVINHSANDHVLIKKKLSAISYQRSAIKTEILGET